MALKDKWIKVGHDFNDLGKEGLGQGIKTTAKDFGKAFVASVATFADKATAWADSKDEPSSAKADTPTEETN